MTYLRNTWYLAAFADELATARMLARTLLGGPRENGVQAMTWHVATPETAERTHYWYWSTRNFAISPEANAARVRRSLDAMIKDGGGTP